MRLHELEEKRSKEQELNNFMFVKKMKMLKTMIEKRTKEKIRYLKEIEAENQALLSKKTSFSSFYKLEDQTDSDRGVIKRRKSSRSKKSSVERDPKEHAALRSLLCKRPGTADAVKRRQLSKRLRQYPRQKNSALLAASVQNREDEIVHDIQVNERGQLRLSRAFTKQSSSLMGT